MLAVWSAWIGRYGLNLLFDAKLAADQDTAGSPEFNRTMFALINKSPGQLSVQDAAVATYILCWKHLLPMDMAALNCKLFIHCCRIV